MSDLKWTREKPTVPGFYWFRDLGMNPSVVEIGADIDAGHVCFVGSENCSHTAEMDCEWCGPLTPPPGGA